MWCKKSVPFFTLFLTHKSTLLSTSLLELSLTHLFFLVVINRRLAVIVAPLIVSLSSCEPARARSGGRNRRLMDFIAPQRHPPKPAHHYRGLHYSEKWVARAQSELFKVARNSKTIIVTQFEVATIILISLYLLQNGREGRRKQNCLHEARIGFNPLSRIFCYCSHRFSHHCREIACHKSSVSNGFNKGK